MSTDLSEMYETHKKEFWIFILVVIPLFLLFGSLFWRELFWDGFLWRYLWGPVVADARGTSIGDVSSGYNPVNTLVYGIVLVIALLGIYDLIGHLDIRIDNTFVFSLIPWIILGGSLRTLEDAGLFSESIAPIFISPIIYMFLGACVIITMVLGARSSELFKEENALLRAAILAPPLLIYGSLGLPYAYIMIGIGALFLSVFYIIGRKQQILNERYLFVSYGTTLLAISLTYNLYFILTLSDTNPHELMIIPFFTIIAVVLFSLPIYFSGKTGLHKLFFTKLNLLIIVSHLFDASATYRGIKYYGYTEKHVIPALAIDLVGDPIVMYLLKVVLVIAVIITIDHFYREELRGYPRLTVLLKFSIITLGMAPAVRNTLRLAMGV